MTSASNDNQRDAAPLGRCVRIIGQVGEAGRVTITDPDWRPTPIVTPEILRDDRLGE